MAYNLSHFRPGDLITIQISPNPAYRYVVTRNARTISGKELVYMTRVLANGQRTSGSYVLDRKALAWIQMVVRDGRQYPFEKGHLLRALP